MRDLDHVLALDCLFDPLRHFLPAGEINDLHRGTAHGIAEQQDLKVRTFSILVNTAVTKIHITVGFDIDLEGSYFIFHLSPRALTKRRAVSGCPSIHISIRTIS